VKEYYDVISVVYIHSEECHGTVEKLGAWASIVKYNKDGTEYSELMENEEFSIIDEIVFKHIEESE
jgi:hypothetical protein